MGAHRQLDAARDSKAGRVNSLLVTGLAGLLVFLTAAGARAQQTLVADDSLAAAQRLYSEKKWEETVRAASGSAAQSSELDYLRGMALVHLERWLEARDAFSSGLLKTPKDSRLLLERAGAEYRLKDFPSAKKDLMEALRLNPKDDYAVEFLGTIYLLEGNLEATLKYWNRIEKPRLSRVASEPEPLLQ